MFFISSWFDAIVPAYWKRLLSFLLMGFIAAFLLFIQRGESIYDPPQFRFILWHLRQTHHLSLILSTYFDIFLCDSNSSSITSSASSFIMISMLSLFECISYSTSLSSLEEIILLVIVNWIFYVPKILRSFMISFKYGLILLRYSSTDSVSLSPLLLYSA